MLQANGIIPAVAKQKRKVMDEQKDEPLSDDDLEESDAAEVARIKALEVSSQALL